MPIRRVTLRLEPLEALNDIRALHQKLAESRDWHA